MNEDWGQRTSGDLSSLLVELHRALKGLRFYEPGNPRCREVVDRAFLAWQAELSRAGALEIWVEEQGIRASGVQEVVSGPSDAELARILLACEVRWLHFDPDLTRAAFGDFAALLAGGVEEMIARGGLAHALAAGDRTGIRVDGEARDTTASAIPRARNGERSRRSAGEPADKPSLEENPLEAAAAERREEELRLRLISLDECIDDDSYSKLAAELAARGKRLADLGLLCAWYRVVLVLADHAVGHGGRSGVQAGAAQATLRELATGSLQSVLIDRACDPAMSVSVRAAQVLLQLGEAVVPGLLDRIDSESDSKRSAVLSGLVLALGERAAPTLVAAIEAGPGGKARTAVRLAGELQSRILVPTLGRALADDSSPLRGEAAKALVQIGSPEAVDALVDTLSTADDRLAEIAACCLGELADRRSLPALLATLDRALAEGCHALSREVVRALAQLGLEAAAPKLASMLERADLIRGPKQGDLKLAVVGALASLPGSDAKRALERATRSPDPEVRRLAQQIRTQARRRSPA